MRVAKIRRLNARQTAENLPKGRSDRRVPEPNLLPSAMGYSGDGADGGDPPEGVLRLENELRQVPLFLRRRRL